MSSSVLPKARVEGRTDVMTNGTLSDASSSTKARWQTRSVIEEANGGLR